MIQLKRDKLVESRIGLGTVQFGFPYGIANTEAKQVRSNEVGEILRAATGHGINLLDTAISYGESEKVLGELGVQDWRIVTKLPAVPDNCANVGKWLKEQLYASCARLRVSSVYGVLLHRPDQIFSKLGREIIASLCAMRSEGKLEKIGVSVYAPEEIEPLFECADFDIVQAPLNVFDRRIVEQGAAVSLKRRGVELHIRSVFLQGLLLMNPMQRPAKFTLWKQFWEEWDSWLAECALEPLEACLGYVSSIQEVDRILVGVNSSQQLNEIIKAVNQAKKPFSAPPAVADIRLIDPRSWSAL